MEINTTELTEQQMADMQAHFTKAMHALTETQRMMNEAGISPPALASASCAAYVSYVAAMSMIMGLDRARVISVCQEAIASMRDYVDEVYERMAETMKESE